MSDSFLLLAGSTLLPATGWVGKLLISNKKTLGWLLITFIQFGWAAFGIATDQWGFALWAVAFFIINGRGWLKWRREEKEKS